MNDLRSRNRTLAPVRELGPRTGEIVSTPPRSRSKKNQGNPLFQASRLGADNGGGSTPAPSARTSTAADAPSSRPSAARPANGSPRTTPVADDGTADDRTAGDGTAGVEAEEERLSFPVSRQVQSMPTSLAQPTPTADDDVIDLTEDVIDLTDGDADEGRPRRDSGPASRPTKRRDVVDEDDIEDDKFPWHYQFDDDEPRELQAKSPLLSRAFRSSVG